MHVPYVFGSHFSPGHPLRRDLSSHKVLAPHHMAGFSKLMRILRYLAGTAKQVIQRQGNDLTLHLYADASYGLHTDGRGHSGLVATVGGDPIFHRSTKQKSVALSSTEAEIIAMSDASTYSHWLTVLFDELRLPQGLPVTMYQDNQSAMHMVQNGLNFKRSKHVTVKLSFVRSLLENGTLRLHYLESKDMLADLHTKSLMGASFVRLTSQFVVSPQA